MKDRPNSALLKAIKSDSLLVTDFVNIQYLTGCKVSAGVVLMTKSALKFFVDGRYMEMAKQKSSRNTKVLPIESLEKELNAQKKVGFEAEDVTVARLTRWKKKFKKVKLIPTFCLIEGLRRCKTQKELQNIKRACSITKKVLAKIPGMLVLGISEIDLSIKIEQLGRSLGAHGLAFETIVAFAENTSRPHHHPTARKLKKGDLVQIDMGVTYNGYCSDYSRVYFTGPKAAAQKKAYRALTEAKKSAEKMLKPYCFSILRVL